MGQAVVWLFQAKVLNQLLETLTVFGQVDGVWCGAEDWDAFILKRLCDFQRCLAAELNDHTVQRAVFLLFGQDFHHVLKCHRFKVQAIRCVVIR